MPAQRKVAPRRVAQLQRKYLRQQGATPQEIRRYQPILTAQIGAESNFTQGVGSPAGAQDIAQFMPGTAPGYGVKLGDNRIKDDIRGQVRYMLPFLRQHGVEGALRAYNAGPAAIERSKGFSETNQYVQRVRSTAGEYRNLVDGRDGPASDRPGRPDRYRTVPGVDNTDARRQLMVDYLGERGKPNALLQLKSGLDQAQDVPETRTRIRQPRQNEPRSPRSPSSSGPKINGQLAELFYNGPGGVNVDNGKRVPKGFVSGHKDHVHAAAADSKTAVQLGKLAQRMGLTVREHPHFDKVDPVHTQGSFHYSSRAIDVSGDPKKMAKFTRRVARLYGV